MPYGTAQGLTDYAAARGITLTGAASALLQRAHDYLETLSYLGSKTSSAQANEWPRTGAVVDGVTLPSDTVPTDIINAEYQTAIGIDQGADPLAVGSQAIKSERVDVIETVYQDGTSGTQSNPVLLGRLRKYLAAPGLGSGNNFLVTRA